MYIYHIATNGEPEQFSIENHRPEGENAPKTQGWMQYIAGTGFELTMRCYEQTPKATYTQPDDPVFQDSCMEAFLDFFPDLTDYGYLNIEINANGAARCRFGRSREDRKYLAEMGVPHPAITVCRQADFWQIHCLLTEKFLEKLYQRPCHFSKGHELRGNFYKCAEMTQPPHWASWTELKRLDFHSPECFGTLTIV